MLHFVGEDLVLVVPPNPVDILTMRVFVAGNFALFLGLAILAFEFGVGARVGIAALGLLAGYMHGLSVVHNPLKETRFVFQPQGRVVVSTLAGKELRNSPAHESRIVLRRRKAAGPCQLEWTWALATVVAPLSTEDFERLQRLGLPVGTEAPKTVHTRLTRGQKRDFLLWTGVWSLPWWGVLYRGISMLLATK